jgi:hypothetical protein
MVEDKILAHLGTTADGLQQRRMAGLSRRRKPYLGLPWHARMKFTRRSGAGGQQRVRMVGGGGWGGTRARGWSSTTRKAAHRRPQSAAMLGFEKRR